MPLASDVAQTRCCVVGGGPAGVILAICLARRGVDVTLLEAHRDFDRAFRGDTLHPSTLELLDQLGWADDVLAIPHGRMTEVAFDVGDQTFSVVDLSVLKTRFPYVAILPQAKLLQFLVERGTAAFPKLVVRMQAKVDEFIRVQGQVVGVRYNSPDGHQELRADLVVAADGRFSSLRKRAGIEPIRTSTPMDVLWFRLSAKEGDPHEMHFRIDAGHLLVIVNRDDYWQLGLVIAKGSYHDLKQGGLEQMRELVAKLAPQFADRVHELAQWSDITPLVVEASRVPRWHQPGLLLIGDAAHVMSPVGGVGINVAIQDAVVAANLLAKPLLEGRLTEKNLMAVQRSRAWSVWLIQRLQSALHKRIVRGAIDPLKPFRPPWILRLPGVRKLAARLIAFGPVRVRIRGEKTPFV
jgi:2-polyprenyl-6-methoxyphenol hydroxylase-like FAD-dependent oxidoreductase